MYTEKDLLKLAETRIVQKYVNVLVPKDNPNWQGPWDCAEFASWAVFQKAGKLYGCTDNNGNRLRKVFSVLWSGCSSAATKRNATES